MAQVDLNVEGIEIKAPVPEAYTTILTPEALSFMAKLVRTFAERRNQLLKKRKERQEAFNRGEKPNFLPETEHIRNGDWTIAPLPKDLLDRRVEITGPAGVRKMVVNALNSGAKMFMADFEDANSPTWEKTMEGQVNLDDAIRRQIEVGSP